MLSPEPAIDALPQPYLLFLGDIAEPAYAKTAYGLRDWAPAQCIGEFACPGAQVSTGLRWLSPAEAYLAGARAMIKRSKLPADVVCEVGEIADTILAVARKRKVALIVMGSHGRSGVKGVLLGSVSTKLIAQTDVPVTIIR